jgi:hypothetical protein
VALEPISLDELRRRNTESQRQAEETRRTQEQQKPKQ